jgi:hypothetical protein
LGQVGLVYECAIHFRIALEKERNFEGSKATSESVSFKRLSESESHQISKKPKQSKTKQILVKIPEEMLSQDTSKQNEQEEISERTPAQLWNDGRDTLAKRIEKDSDDGDKRTEIAIGKTTTKDYKIWLQ